MNRIKLSEYIRTNRAAIRRNEAGLIEFGPARIIDHESYVAHKQNYWETLYLYGIDMDITIDECTSIVWP